MAFVPRPPDLNPSELVHVLEDRFRAIGVTFPDDRLFVNIAWLYHRASLFMEAVRKADQEMEGEGDMEVILAELQISIDDIMHFCEYASRDVSEVLGD